MSDLPDDERLAHLAQLDRVLAGVDAANADLAERAERRAATGIDLEERHAERLRQQERPDPAAGQRRLVEQIDRRIAPAVAQLRREREAGARNFARALGVQIAKLEAAQRATLRAEIAAAQAKAEERIAALEQRLEQLEQRPEPTTPRLVGTRHAS